MRVSPICSAQYCAPRKVVSKKNFTTTPMVNQQPSFQGWKGSLGALFGAGVGLGLGIVLSGGLLAPMLMSMGGTVVGGMYGDSKDDHSGEDDYEPVDMGNYYP